MKESEESYLTINDLSKYLKIKKRTLYHYVEILEIPYYRIGRLIRFKQSEIDEWMKTKKQELVDIKNNIAA